MNKINDAHALKEFKSTRAYAILKQYLEDQVGDSRGKWLTATPEQAEILRQQAGVFKQVLNFIDTTIVKGERAEAVEALMLEKAKEE
jgi:cytochrome oxidase Cu insertion factor (SCO1/SenC/PrrC family)